MIKKISIENFKSIEKISIDLKKFNLLCGENASGKTTVIHALLATLQSYDNAHNFDGNIIKIGGLSELRNWESDGDLMIKIEGNDGCGKKVVLKRNEDINQDNKELLLIDSSENSLDLSFEKDFFYLSSIRNGVMEIYSKGNFSFGVDGSSSIGYLFEHQDNPMDKTYMDAFENKYPESACVENPKFFEHVRFWLKKITGEEINIDYVSYTNQYVLTFGNDRKIRPINTGSGYSFVLPIIITCLGAIKISRFPMIIIENPEIYLHPEAQINLVEFFEFLSQYAQFIIETHSEYILKRSMDVHGSKQILVFRKKGGKTENCILDNTSFKTFPVSYPEVLYKAFNICTSELHILLFSKLQVKSGEKSISGFDKWLLKNYAAVPKKNREFEGKITNTLPVYIRNTLDHPEGKETDTGNSYDFSKTELEESVDFMFSIL